MNWKKMAKRGIAAVMAAALVLTAPAVTSMAKAKNVRITHEVLAENAVSGTIAINTQTVESGLEFLVGAAGNFELDRTDTVLFPEEKLAGVENITYTIDGNTETFVVDAVTGAYEAKDAGEFYLNISGTVKTTDELTGEITEETIALCDPIKLVVGIDMSDVELTSTKATLYVPGTGTEYDTLSAHRARFVFTGAEGIFNHDGIENQLKVTVSNKKIIKNYSCKNNVLTVRAGSTGGKAGMDLVIYGKPFHVDVTVIKLKQVDDSTQLLAINQSKRLTIQATDKNGNFKKLSGQKLKWKSDKPSVVKVSSAGNIRALKSGNALISAKLDTITFYWIVSSTTGVKKTAIERGKAIAKGTYSQPKRMQAGYYDCSSLVWRAYSPLGYNFGATGYAPVAASEASYLAGQGKMVSGGLSDSNIQNRKLIAGDLLFKCGANNGRYMGIYHVEMITGYRIYDFTSAGKPKYVMTWVNRYDGYASWEKGKNMIVGRP